MGIRCGSGLSNGRCTYGALGVGPRGMNGCSWVNSFLPWVCLYFVMFGLPSRHGPKLCIV